MLIIKEIESEVVSFSVYCLMTCYVYNSSHNCMGNNIVVVLLVHFVLVKICHIMTQRGFMLTTILPILFPYLNTVIVTAGTFEPLSGRFGALKSDSTHHFFRNACTKSGSLRFSQFSGCWLNLSVYIIMSFDFPFVRLFGVR